MSFPEFPELTTSASQWAQLQDCPRRWWFRHVRHWHGWDDDVPEEVRLAYRLGKLQSARPWVGTCIHQGVAQLLAHPDRASAPFIEGIAAEMRTQFVQSERIGAGRFGSPKSFRLLEHYSGRDVPDDLLESSIAQFRESVVAFERFCRENPGFDFRQLAADAKKAGRFVSIDTNDIPIWERKIELETDSGDTVGIYASPDFVVEGPDNSLLIIDWKTGGSWSPEPEGPGLQRLFYLAWLRLAHKQVVDRATKIEWYEFHLPGCSHRGGPVSMEDVDAAVGQLHGIAEQLIQLRGTDDAVPRASCPPKPERVRCQWCNFLQICKEGLGCQSSRSG